MLNTEKYRGRVTVTAARNDETRSCGVLITTTINKTFIIYTRTPVERDIWVCMITQAVANLSGHIHSVRSKRQFYVKVSNTFITAANHKIINISSPVVNGLGDSKSECSKTIL